HARKHPHGRGEDVVAASHWSRSPETPPRAWGRQRLKPRLHGRIGNTPTGVGKTTPRWPPTAPPQKHPHGRGEDASSITGGAGGSETPPRAWGRLFVSPVVIAGIGNTPTGVGKTPSTEHK